MTRPTFLPLAALVALAVGATALFAPSVLLASKGVSSEAAAVWLRQVGILLIALGLIALLVRHHPDSATLKALLLGNALVQLGLFPLEILAYRAGTITELAGIVPNSIVHLVLAAGFLYYATTMRIHAR